MPHSRNLCISGVSRRCVYASSIHMHAKINGLSVILKLAEFDPEYRIPFGDAECKEVRNAAHIRRSSSCCPECKCGSGENAPPVDPCSKESVFSIRSIMSHKSNCSVKSTKKKKKPKLHNPSKEKKCRPRKPFCVFKRKTADGVPKKRKCEEPEIKPKVKKLTREDMCPPAKKPPPIWERHLKEKKSIIKHTKTKEDCTPKKHKKAKTKNRSCRPVFLNTGTSTCSENVREQYNVHTVKSGFGMFMDAGTSTSSEAVRKQYNVQPLKSGSEMFLNAGKSTCSEAIRKQYNAQPVKSGSEMFMDAGTSTFSEAVRGEYNVQTVKSGSEMLVDAGTSTFSEAVRKQHNVQPVKSGSEMFMDAGTSTCSEAIKKQHNVQPVKSGSEMFMDVGTSTCSETLRNHYKGKTEKSGFGMPNKMEPVISGDTIKTSCSVNTDNLSSLGGNSTENSKCGSDDMKYRFIACQLREGITPESLITSLSKSTTGPRDCLEATVSIYAPSLSSMAPHRFDESHEILSTIIDHASVKAEKTTETSTYPAAFSASTSAQTCLVDYELFKGLGCSNKIFKKDYLIEETLTNTNLLQKSDSSSV